MNKTITYYDANAELFFQSTKDADVSGLYRMLLDRLPQGGRILDLGCGSGRDSRYFMDLGYKVTAVDGSEKMSQLAEQYIGQKVVCCCFEALHYEKEFDGIWACASLLHVERKKLPGLLKKLSRTLVNGGVMYASFKYGSGEREKDGRLFNDYCETDIEELFNAESGFTCLEWCITEDVRQNRAGEKWLNVVAKRIEI